jgi:hypothetical protein
MEASTCTWMNLYTQRVQVLLGLCPLNTQDMNYSQNVTLFLFKIVSLWIST